MKKYFLCSHNPPELSQEFEEPGAVREGRLLLLLGHRGWGSNVTLPVLGSFILFFWAEIWLLLSLGLHMKGNAFVLKHFARRLCVEQQGREWNGMQTCSHDIDKWWNGLASRKQTVQKNFSRLKSDLILLFQAVFGMLSRALHPVWFVKHTLCPKPLHISLQEEWSFNRALETPGSKP